jgi:hypothetical protein
MGAQGGGVTGDGGGSAADAARRELEALYREWFGRVGPEPGDFFQRVLSDDWVYIDYLGVTRGKADYEPYIAGVAPGTAPKHPRDLHVRLFEAVAVVDGSYLIGEADGGGGTWLRFTAVWIRRSGSWVALAHHTSAVAS